MNVVSFLPHLQSKVELERAESLIAKELPKFSSAVRTVDFTTYDQKRLDAFAKAWSALVRVHRTLIATESPKARASEERFRRSFEQIQFEFAVRRIAPDLRAMGKHLSLEPL